MGNRAFGGIRSGCHAPDIQRGMPGKDTHGSSRTSENIVFGGDEVLEPSGAHQNDVKPLDNPALESWVIQIQKRFESRQFKSRQPSSSVSIYRVPATIRASKPKAYVPLVSSFGPYHHHNEDQQLSATDDYKLEAVAHRTLKRFHGVSIKEDPQLYPMDDYKLEAVHRILKRFHGLSMPNLIVEVRKLEGKIRSRYEDSAIEHKSETLAWMFTMDACFILEFFWTSDTELINEGESISLFFQYNDRQNIFRWEIMRDILKLENQIPLFVLIRILKLGLKNKERAVLKLVELLAPYKQFRGFPFKLSSLDDKFKSRLKNHIQSGASHLLDLSRRVINDFLLDSSSCSIVSSSIDSCTRRSPSIDHSIPSAEKLSQAGIMFKPAPDGNFRFEGGCYGSTLYIPEITIDDNTEILLRNIIAFEECQGCRLSPEPTIIPNYMHLMDDLIDTSNDVGALKKEKVIESMVGSDNEVATMINDLCKEITHIPNHQYNVVVDEVRQHYDSHLKVWISQFIEEKCSKPWYVVSLVAATLLLGMTAVQTFFTVKN